jgi:hypothetical protein
MIILSRTEHVLIDMQNLVPTDEFMNAFIHRNPDASCENDVSLSGDTKIQMYLH